MNTIPWQGMVLLPRSARLTAVSTTETGATPFGAALRHWRTSQGWSQLDLSLEAETTTRHLSFLETGRSRPSRAMVDRLSAALTLPLRERNSLYVAAGFSPAFTESDIEDPSMEGFRRAIDMLLDKHNPYPAYAIDGHWNIVRANTAAQLFLPPDGERNVIRLTYGGPWQALIDNWDQLAWLGVRRVQADASRFPDDPELKALVELATASAAAAPKTGPDGSSHVMCPRFRIGDNLVSTIAVVAQFGAPLDVTLDELRIELIFPADQDADLFFQPGPTPDQSTQ